MTIIWEAWLRGGSPTDGTGCEARNDAAEALINVLGAQWVEADFRPTAADKKAAWAFYTQLRSRIVTRPLPYLDGDELAALTSIYDLFQFTRNLCVAEGPECHRFSDLVWTLLNGKVRKLTAKWHKRFVNGRLKEDDRREFREELTALQAEVRYFEPLFLALSQEGQINVTAEAAERSDPTAEPEPLPFTRILFSPSVDVPTAEAIHVAETEAIRERRGQDVAVPIADLTGLALSGGGLRSATFALGALQGLAKNGMLSHFDYLSTVSGGGYAGSFLSSYLNANRTPDGASIGLGADDLPFQRDDAQESAPLRHLRSSSKSLLAGGFWRKLEIPVLALLGWVASVAVALPPIALLTVLLVATNQNPMQRAINGVAVYDGWCYPHAAVGIAMLLVMVGLIAIGVRQHWRRRSGVSADLPGRLIAVVGCLLLIALGLLAWLLFPYLAYAISKLSFSGWALPAVSESVIAAISAALIPIFSRMASRTSKGSALRPLLSTTAVAILPLIFIAMVATLLARYGLFHGQDFAFSPTHAWYWVIGSVVVLAFCVSYLNVNSVSLHPFYRDRIARAYHLTPADGVVTASSKHKLSRLRVHNTRGPYHLINASLNAPAGTNPALRGRIADFFLFSSAYCGSESTGYRPTADFETFDPSLDLGTAIAISGAAAAPFMGVNASRFSFWASLLNIRLDYWLPIPGRLVSTGSYGIMKRLIGRLHPSANALYWLRQYIGLVHESTAYVNLSDGGHIENMGLYELLRRRCRYIVLVDGECDPGISCGSLLQAIRYAKIDFGIEIKIDLSRLKFAEARPQTGAGEPAEPMPRGADASPTVDFHFALGEIVYPKCDGDSSHPPRGLLLYLKSSISGNEGKAIESYREREPEFPHQSTGDLAYDEEQFESYRALGEHIVDDALRRELVGDTPPGDIAEWLRNLSRRLHRDPA